VRNNLAMPDFVGQVAAVLAQASSRSGALEAGLTESVCWMTSRARWNNACAQRMGVGLSMDDFGTGIRRYPI